MADEQVTVTCSLWAHYTRTSVHCQELFRDYFISHEYD